VRRASERRAPRAWLIGVALASLFGLASCRGRSPSGSPAGSAAVSTVGAPPVETFQIEVDAPPKAGSPAAVPPDAVLSPFRVWVNQETPRQKKNPEWRLVPPKEGLVLELSPGGRWRCVASPLHVLGKIGEKRTPEEWLVSSTVRCSSDGWKTFAEAFVQVAYDSDGSRERADARDPLGLNDFVDGQPRITTVVLDAPPARVPPKPPAP
jgi:hypothetical protein